MTDDPLDDSIDEPGPALGPLLPPEDRIWRHPSEVSNRRPGLAARRVAHPWGTAAFSAVGGAVAVGALWLAIGSDDGRLATERVSLVPIHTVSPRVVEADEWASAVTATARQGTVSVMSPSQDHAVAGAVAYRDDGYLLTSARAIGDTASLTVVSTDGVAHEVSVVGADSRTDVSVLHVELVAGIVVVAGGDGLETGDKLAIVDPGGGSVESTVTDTTSHAWTIDGDTVLGVIELDVELGQVPPGSPAVDDTGAVVGITTATGPQTAAALVPIDVARHIAADLIDDGVATHSWLGVTARDVTADELSDGLPVGALVTSITPGGPAADAGISPGDTIVGVATTPVDSVSAMVSALRHLEPGDEVTVTVYRGGRDLGLDVELGRVAGTDG